MIEQLQGVEVQGKGFLQKRSFALFGKNQERIALVFGRNGTGKSIMDEVKKLPIKPVTCKGVVVDDRNN